MAECWKKAYVSAVAAWGAVGKLKVRRRQGSNPKVEQRAYHCPFCSRWHLTSQTRRERHERYQR